MSDAHPVFACTCGVAWGTVEGPCVCETPDHMIRDFCRATRDDDHGDGLACFLSDGHEGQHIYQRWTALPDGHPNHMIGGDQ